MFATQATMSRKSIATRITRHITTSACAIALAVLVAGNVSAAELERDGDGTAAIAPGLESLHLIDLKLRTTAGYNVLVFG